jgi:hypothetical protein
VVSPGVRILDSPPPIKPLKRTATASTKAATGGKAKDASKSAPAPKAAVVAVKRAVAVKAAATKAVSAKSESDDSDDSDDSDGGFAIMDDAKADPATLLVVPEPRVKLALPPKRKLESPRAGVPVKSSAISLKRLPKKKQTGASKTPSANSQQKVLKVLAGDIDSELSKMLQSVTPTDGKKKKKKTNKA